MSKTKFYNINWSAYVATSNRGDGCAFINDGFNQIAVLDFKKTNKTKVISRAHLIAAAPEMYVASINAMALLDRLGMESCDEYQELLSVTKKARGEA